jgi:hypothetical protein
MDEDEIKSSDFVDDDPEYNELMNDASDEWEKFHPANDEFGPSYVSWLNKEMGK